MATISRTVSSKAPLPSWGTVATRRARSLAENPARSRPSRVIRPWVGARVPYTQRSRVVLPLPLGPTRPTVSPGATCRSAPSTRWRPSTPYDSPSVRSSAGAAGCVLGPLIR